MANFFDQFDESQAGSASNFFDQFDAPIEKKAEAAAETPEDQSFLRSIADVPLKIAGGAVTGVRMVADAFGAGSDISKNLRGAEDWIADLYSAQSKQDSQEVARIMKEAEDKGVADQVMAAIEAFSVAPIDIVTNALGTAAPAVIAGLAATVGAAPAAVATGVGLGVGALMGAGTVKSAIYEATKEILAEKVPDLSPEQIEEAAIKAQEYGGENLDQILIGTGVGAIAARTGAEPQLIRQLSKGIATRAAQKEAVEQAAGQTSAAAAKRGAAKQAGVTAAKEFATESVQGGQEQLAANLAQQRQGFDTPLMRGVVAQGALEGLAGAGMGAVTGAKEGLDARAEARAAEPEPTPLPPSAPAALPESAPGVVRQTLSDEEKQTRIRQVADDIVASTNMAEEDALGIAAQRVEQELALKETQVPKVSTESREKELTVEFLDAGFPVEEAVEKAKTQAQEEAQADAQIQSEAGVQPGGTVAGDTTSGQQPTRAGVPVVDELGIPNVTAPERAAAVEPSGVVPAGQDAGSVIGGEELTTPSVADITTQTAAAVEQELTGAAPEAEAEPAVEPTAEEQVATDEARKQQAIGIAKANFDSAFAEQESFRDINEAIDAYYQNTVDTLQEQGFGEEAATDAAMREYDRLVADYKKTKGEQKPAEEVTLEQELDTALAAPQTQAAITAAVEKINTKRGGARAGAGRKPAVLTTEERAAKDKATKEGSADLMALKRAVDKAETEMNEVMDTSGLEGVTGPELQREVSTRKEKLQQAVDILYRVYQRNKGRKQGNRARDLLKNENIPANILAEAKRRFKDVGEAAEVRGVDISTARASERSTGVAPANEKIAKAKNAQQLLTVIAGHNKFFKFLAGRLRPFVANVNVVVIEVDSVLPDQLQRHVDSWNQADGSPRAVGMMVSNKGNNRTIYLRGSSFGADQGVNVVTALHEVLHSALDLKIKTGVNAAVKGLDLDKGTEKFLTDVYDLMELAENAFVEMYSNGTAPASLVQLMRSSARKDADGNIQFQMFNDPWEFLAYGLSDDVMQAFLKRLPGFDSRNAFTKFVDAIRRVLGLEPGQTNALLSLVDVADRVLSTRQTSEMQEAYKTKGELSSAQEALRTQKQIKRDVKRALKKVATSSNAQEVAEAGSELQLLRDPRKNIGAIKIMLSGAPVKAKQLMLNLFTNDALAAAAKAAGLPRVEEVTKMIQDMHGMTGRLLEGASDVLGNVFRAVQKDPALRRKLEVITHTATLANIDPDVDKSSEALNKLWNDLGEVGQREYRRLRDYYGNISELYSKLLDDQVNDLALDSADKNNLLSKLKQVYEPGNKISPYFPLVRRGDFWLSTGSGPSREFYMFENRAEREALLAKIAKDRGVSKDELLESLEVEVGNNIASLRKASFQSSTMLKDLFEAVDAMNFTGDPAQARSELKDAIYQMYLTTMPEQSMRRQFINRKGVTGFSTDLMRNFSEVATNSSYQLARIKYSRKMRQAAQAAASAAENNEALFPYVEELNKRVNLELPTEQSDSGVADKLATFANRAAYIHYLSGASSALLQPMQLISVGFNVLGARHGFAKTTVELVKLMNIFNEFGVYKQNADGTKSLVMPSIRFSKSMKVNEEERRALTKILGSGVADLTLNNEIVSRKETPTDKYGTRSQRIKRAALIATTGLMHTTERLSREVMVLTSYRLSRAKGMSVDAAIDQAISDTYEGLGNMGPSNRPPIMRNPGGKVALQFMMFPLYMASFLLKNFKRMLPLLNKEGKKEAATMFFGTLGSTWMLAGSVGMPLFSSVMGMVGWAMNNIGDDDDEYPETLKSMDYETWWRKVWLPEVMGDVNVGGVPLSTIIERGPTNAFTGLDFSSRLGLNDMFVRDRKETRTTKEGAISFGVERAGPFVGQILSYMDGYDALTQGDYQKAVEKFAPAFVRNFALAGKFSQEGAKDFRGAELIAREDYSTGQMIGQAIGFRSDELANMQNLGFKLSAIEQRINFDRSEILNIADRVFRKGDQDGIDKIMQRLMQFNQKYPAYAITAENLLSSLKNRAEQRAKSSSGVIQSKKNLSIPGVAEALNSVR